jgi:hypothetical protein
MTVVALNRFLFCLIVLVGACAAIYPLLGSVGGQSAEPIANTLPSVTDAAVENHPLAFDSRNAFDPEGLPWHASVRAPTQSAATADVTVVQAVVKLHGIEGVITANGFVAVGESIGGGTLKKITPTGYVITTAAGERTIAVDPGREQRLRTLLGGRTTSEPEQ